MGGEILAIPMKLNDRAFVLSMTGFEIPTGKFNSIRALKSDDFPNRIQLLRLQ